MESVVAPASAGRAGQAPAGRKARYLRRCPPLGAFQDVKERGQAK